MPEPLGHHGEVDAGGEHQRRRAVPQVVQPDLPQPGPGGEPVEVPGDVLGVQRFAVLPGEHEPLVVVRVAPLRAFGVLGEPVRQQDPDRALVEVDSAVLPGGGLGPADDDLVAELHQLLPHVQDGAFEVNVDPAQPARLPAAQPGHGDQLVQRAEPIRGGVVEERS